MLRGCAVGKDVALLHRLADRNDRALVDAGALVGALELNEFILVADAVRRFGDNLIRADGDNLCILARKHHHAGVVRSLVFHARTNHRGFRHEQRHGLALHVGTHQRAVRVVVFKEGDHGGCHRNELFGRNVHVIHIHVFHFDDLVELTGHNTVLFKPDFPVVHAREFIGLGHDVLVLLIGRKVDDVIKNLPVLRIHLAVRRLNKSIFVDARIGRKRIDEADVRSFRRLNGAHAPIVRIVHVAHIERGALTVEATGAERGKAALMRELCKRVGLIHELRKLRRTEEFLDRGRHRADVDEVGGHGSVHVLQAHALAHHALKARHANADLVLQQLAHAADAAVAEMVDVIRAADAIGHSDQVADGGYDVVRHNMAGDQVVYMCLEECLQGFLVHVLRLRKQLHQGRVMHLLIQACFLGVERQIRRSIHEVVAKHLDLFVFHRKVHGLHTRIFDVLCSLAGNHLALAHEHFARGFVNDRLGAHMAEDAGGERKLFVEFIAAHARQIIALVKEQRVQKAAGAFLRGRLAGALALINLDEAVLNGFCGILFKRGEQTLLLAQKVDDLGIGAIAERAQQRSDKHLALAVDLHIHDLVGIGFVF